MYRILYVDDEEDLLEIGKLFLEMSGDLSVVTIDSAPAALALLKNEQFDAIVSDYQMPGMNGIQFLVEVRSRFGKIPVILFTGKGREEIVIEAINNGVDYYLQKGGEPHSQFAELEHKIKQAVSRKIAEDSLRKSEEKYRQLIQNSDEAIVVAQDGILRLVNQRAVELSGYPEDELLSMSFLEFIHPDDRAMVAERYQQRLRGEGVPMRYPFRLNPKDGSTKWVEIGAIIIDWDGRPATLNFLTDITERKRAEDALHSRNRALLLISNADSLMMHATEEQTLLDEICKMIIGTGGYRMVWIGFALQDATKSVKPVAQSGFDDGYLETINILWADEKRGKGPTGTAIRTGRYCIARNIRTDPAFIPWRDAAIRHGYQSSIALPLENEGAIFGALNIYSGEPDRFDDDEIALLSQLARDLSFGIHTLRAQVLRRKAEEALVNSEEKYRLIVENSRDIIYILSTTGMFLYVSPSVTQVLGYRPEDLIGQPFTSIIHPDDITSLQKRFARIILEDYETEGIEYRARHFSGEWRWHISRGHAVRDSAGNVLNFTGIANDITERKKTDDELRLTYSRLDSAMETGSIAWWEMECSTGNVTFNERKARMLGYPVEQFSHYNDFTRLIHPDDYEPAMKAMRDHLSGIKKQYDTDYRIRTRNGEYRWFHDTGSISAFTPDGKPSMVTGFVIDITERKHAEEAVLDSEQKYRELFESSHDAIIILEPPTWKFTSGNKASLALFGIPGMAEFVTLGPWDVAPEYQLNGRNSVELAKEMIETALRKGSNSFEWMHKRIDGTTFLSTILLTRMERHGTIFLQATVNDITEQKRAEEQLRIKNIVFESSIAANSIADNKGIITSANPAFLSIWGYWTKEDVIGKSLGSFFANELDAVRVLEALGTFGRWDGEFTARRADDSTFIAHGIATVIRNEAGKQIGYQSTVLDITMSKQAEEELVFKNALLSTQQETLPGAILIVNESGKILNYNRVFIEMLGIPDDVIASRSDERALQSMIEKVADKEVFLARISYLNDHIYDKSYDEILLKDGRVLDRYSAPMFGEKQRYFGRFWYFRDITDRKKAEAELLKSLHEKELLLKEIHHRVKNNLQTIASLLYLQSLSCDDGQIKILLNEARSRVNAMGLIHQKLYQSTDISRVPFTDYINILIESLKESYGVDATKIRFFVQVTPENLTLDIDTGIPCGLIINELVTNTLKYAFRNRPGGTITIHMSRDEQHQYVLSVSDDGGGIPAELDVSKLKSLGMTIVSSLVRQLDGTMEIVREPGTTITIRFPAQTPHTSEPSQSAEKPGADKELSIDEKIKRIRARHD